jgi:hypothetical protein
LCIKNQPPTQKGFITPSCQNCSLGLFVLRYERDSRTSGGFPSFFSGFFPSIGTAFATVGGGLASGITAIGGGVASAASAIGAGVASAASAIASTAAVLAPYVPVAIAAQVAYSALVSTPLGSAIAAYTNPFTYFGNEIFMSLLTNGVSWSSVQKGFDNGVGKVNAVFGTYSFNNQGVAVNLNFEPRIISQYGMGQLANVTMPSVASGISVPLLQSAINTCPTCPKFDVWNGDRGFWGNLNASSNPIKKFAYNYANSAYLTSQAVFPNIGLDYINPLTGERAFTNLDDSPQYDSGERIFAATTIALPYMPLSTAKLSLVAKPKTLNASQFSKTFKKTKVNKLTPSFRGMVNRYYNKAIKYLDSKINTSGAFIKATNTVSKFLSQYF